MQKTFRTFTLGCGRTSALPFGCICKWIEVCFASLGDHLTKSFPRIYRQQFWVCLWSLMKFFLRWRITWRVSKTRLRRYRKDQTTSCLCLDQCLVQCLSLNHIIYIYKSNIHQDTTSLRWVEPTYCALRPSKCGVQASYTVHSVHVGVVTMPAEDINSLRCLSMVKQLLPQLRNKFGNWSKTYQDMQDIARLR